MSTSTQQSTDAHIDAASFDKVTQDTLIDAAMAIASRRTALQLEMKEAILSDNLLHAFECACKLTGISEQQAAKQLAALASLVRTSVCHDATL